MKILYIGTPDTYKLYTEGKNPSHWLYGAVEMEKDGHNVVWECEQASLLNDWHLVRKTKADVIFIPNLNIKSHILLLLLKSLGIIRIPLYAYIHHSPTINNNIKKIIYKILFKGINHSFFLSPKTMSETIERGVMPKSKCSVPNWGPDLDFYKKFQTEDCNDFFISTGKENRDFDTLIEAFSATKEKLKIITSESHAGRTHTYLQDKCKTIPNIEVIITKNSGEVYPTMIKEMAQAKALVCPLLKERLTYCVGLSTITDAEGLGKPLIITANPYHEKERTDKFNVVTSTSEWIDSINKLNKNIPHSNYNMNNCYKNMKRVMFL